MPRSSQDDSISRLVEELSKQTDLSFTAILNRMRDQFDEKDEEYTNDRWNRHFRNKERYEEKHYKLEELRAFLHAVTDDLPPYQRCTVDQAFRLFRMADMPRNNFEALKEFFEEAEYQDAWERHETPETSPDDQVGTPSYLKPPYPDVVVIGRDSDINRIWRRLGAVSGFERQPLTVIRGWPGVGKTTVVNHIVHDKKKVLARHYPDGILWTSLGPSGDALQALKKWARQIGAVHIEAMHSLEDVTQNMRFALEGKRLLVVVDDVWNDNQANAFTSLRSAQSTFLFATRFSSLALDVGVTLANVYPLEGLSVDQSIELMKVFAPNASEAYADQMRPLVETLEGLPLALRVAGRLLEEQFFLDFDPTSLFDELQTNFRAFKDKAPSDRFDEATGQTPTIGMLFRRSLQTLPRAEQEAFACMGHLAPKPASFDLRAIGAICDLENPEATARALVGRGLLEPQGDGRFQMHYTLAMYGRHLLETELAELEDG